MTRHSAGESKLRYKTHRAVDPQHEVITSTLVTPGSTDEGAMLREVIQGHEQNTDRKVETAVADSRYGTIENFLFCQDAEIKAHIPSLEESQRGLGRQEDIFPKEVFAYDPDQDRRQRLLWERYPLGGEGTFIKRGSIPNTRLPSGSVPDVG